MTAKVNLKEITLFSQLSDEAVTEIAAALKEKQLAADETVFNQGDPGDDMFIVQEGRLSLFIPSKDKPGQERPFRICEPGEIIGEMALIDRRPRSLSCRALEPTRLLVFGGDYFRRLLRQYPDMAIAVMSGLNERIRYTTDFLGEVRGWVKRVAAGDYKRGFKPSTDYQDRTIATLAAEFAQMAAEVKKREDELRKEVVQLRIEIDQAKKERQVGEIVESEYFQHLKAQARELRRREEE